MKRLDGVGDKSVWPLNYGIVIGHLLSCAEIVGSVKSWLSVTSFVRVFDSSENKPISVALSGVSLSGVSFATVLFLCFFFVEM